MGQSLTENLQLKSPVFNNDAEIPEKYTCDGQNISPPLNLFSPHWEVQSFALIVDDPDATYGTFTHWLIWNIDTNISEIEEDTVPTSAIQGRNSAGDIGYTGPCPPTGVHRYLFKLYALNSCLTLPAGSSKEEFEQAIEGHVLDEVTLIGRYARKTDTN
jgi:Raf kinase inhibitor-like YbhB/YbcL family protein